jgi:hypothetical protein
LGAKLPNLAIPAMPRSSKIRKRSQTAPISRAPQTSAAPRRWLKFCRRTLLALMILFIALHAWWGHWSEKALDRQIRAYAALGEPIYVSELDDKPLPDEQNAALPLRQATERLKFSPLDRVNLDAARLRLPLTPAQGRLISNLVQSNSASLRALDDGASRPCASWNERLRSPVRAMPGESFDAYLDLAHLLRAAILQAHQDGDEAEAIDRLEQMLAVSRIIDSQGSAPAHLTAISIAALAARTAGEIAPELRVRAPAAIAVRRLIEQFLDQEPLRQGQLRALLASRVMLWDTAKSVAGGRADLIPHPQNQPAIRGGRIGCYGAKPVLMEDALWMIRYATATIAAARSAGDWPAFVAAAPADPFELLRARTHFLARAILPDYKLLILDHYRALTECRLAAVALAAGQYRSDHPGATLWSLQDLVPGYLPYVPFDPMAAGNKPLRLIISPDRVAIYSVGDDGVDDGGSEVIPIPAGNAARVADDNPWARRDVVIRLDRSH